MVETAITVEIPADVKDNSETVTDYAFMRHRALPDWPYHTVATRDREIMRVTVFPGLDLTHYSWLDVNPNDQRCRFDMIVNRHGQVVNLFHTEYWTRVKCTDCKYHYAASFLQVTDWDGNTHPAAPYCEYHGGVVKKINASLPGYKIAESERLLIGQHD